MSNKARLTKIKEAPLSWKEIDLLTAAEKYMEGAIDFPLIEIVLPCCPKTNKGTIDKITQVCRCLTASFHLKTTFEKKNNNVSEPIQLRAALIYEQEAQRILGSIFSLEDKFWKAFYSRQQSDVTKPLVAIDALHFITNSQEQIAHQLLLQSFKAILKGHYETGISKKAHFENATRLLIDLPIVPLQSWINLPLI